MATDGFNPSKGYRHFGTSRKKAGAEAPAKFQSLKGISAFWNLFPISAVSPLVSVSIPQRDIGILELFSNPSVSRISRFNPSKGYRHFGTNGSDRDAA